METYKKPVITSDGSVQGAVPAAVAAGFSLALLKGKTKIDSAHTQALPRKKSVE